LCAGEKVIGGGIANIWGKDVTTVVEEVIIRRTALTLTLDKYRAICSQVRATNSKSP
jgi:hypothetical protein